MTSSFAQLAVEIRLAASREAMGAEALEMLAARSDEPVFATTLNEVRATGAKLGEAYNIFLALIPHEAAVRAMIAPPRSEAA